MGGIVWLASYPKSGNTWLRAFLHNLLLNPATPVDINTLERFTLGDTNARWYQQLTDKPYDQLTKEEQASLRPKVTDILTRTSADTVFVKTHHFLGQDSGVPLIAMTHTLGAIYVVRNPLDLIISMRHHYGMTMDEALDFMASDDAHTGGRGNHVLQVLTSWSNHVRSWTASQNTGMLVLRYEDMLSKPQKSFASVAKYLNLKPPRDRLNRAIRFSSFKVLRGQEDQKGFTERPDTTERFFRKGTSGQWKTDLAEAQVARLVADHREQMQQFGYIPKGY